MHCDDVVASEPGGSGDGRGNGGDLLAPQPRGLSFSSLPPLLSAMVHSSVLGFPRMGPQRELKKALEAHWAGTLPEDALLDTARKLRVNHWKLQKEQGVDIIPSNDHSLFDHVLDHSLLFNLIPSRYTAHGLAGTELLFAMGRGLQRPATGSSERVDVPSQEMVKWFDSNYHYFRPEVGPSSDIRLSPTPKPVAEFLEAKESAGIVTRPVLLGPVSLLVLAKATKDAPADFKPIHALDRIVPAYVELLRALRAAGATEVQIDEPVLVFDLPAEVTSRFKSVYDAFASEVPEIAITLATYFGSIAHNVGAWAGLPVAALHVDLVRAPEQLPIVLAQLGEKQILSAGVVDGRNVWKTDYAKVLALLRPLVASLGAARVRVASSSSLLHTPHSLEGETAIRAEAKPWLAFAKEKLREVSLLARALRDGPDAVQAELAANAACIADRASSAYTLVKSVRDRQAQVTPAMHARQSPFPARQEVQRAALKLPPFPTTTIGSFPQTKEIRLARDRFTKGLLSAAAYDEFIRDEIRRVVAIQEEIGLDVLVHGEPERNDMVQYFLERMEGCVFTANGWVQSYGSRCVRPPIIVGDIARPLAMTVKESVFAVGLTKKPMKGMLTGPVTCLRWSFPRDDVPLQLQCQQLALAIRDEVRDLEQAGVAVIQIDEPALREGLPLRQIEHAAYLQWAVDSFRLATSCVRDATQIHSHFCYSDFNEILSALKALDADVITIESSKSDLKLLAALAHSAYTSEIGPGVYDIHSPRVPSVDEMFQRIRAMSAFVQPGLLWVNPDCGLKTRAWAETRAALTNMVQAAQQARKEINTNGH